MEGAFRDTLSYFIKSIFAAHSYPSSYRSSSLRVSRSIRSTTMGRSGLRTVISPCCSNLSTNSICSLYNKLRCRIASRRAG